MEDETFDVLSRYASIEPESLLETAPADD